MKLEHTLTPCTKIISKWLKDLDIRQDTIKLLEKNIGKTFPDIDSINVFTGQSPKALEMKTKINQWDLIKLNSFCIAKETLKKKTPTKWENTVANDATQRALPPKFINNSYTLTEKKKKRERKKNGQKT